jgi:aspartyl-tRNA(Asn)/glutamyl-tRNA(Gln) amidotransferase subunit B
MTIWEPVIGLEIHVELNTKSKLFSGAPNRFGDEPNVNIDVVCTGQPGSLPVLNKEAVRKAVQFGCALKSEIALFSAFDRKSYFYPDNPRNYQITQYDYPLLKGGYVEALVGDENKRFYIERAHLEDDTGMLKHFTRFAGIDFNRAGVPLIEVVSEPCMHSPKEAVAYAMAIKSIMEYLDASYCNMEEGHLRIDCNISVRIRGETSLRERMEIKNMNSFTNMEMALEAAIARQIQEYEADPNARVGGGTYRFDLENKAIVLMRAKEGPEDYCYFPEPDLPHLLLSQEYIDDIRAHLPELPQERHSRYCSQFGLSKEAADLLIRNKALCDYFDSTASRCSNPIALFNWITVEFTGRLKDLGLTLVSSRIPAHHITELVELIQQNIITGKIAKLIADEMLKRPELSPRQIAEQNPDYHPIHNHNQILSLIQEVLAAQPQAVSDFKMGKEKAYAFLIGQVMKLCKGSADPQIVTQLLREQLDML